MDSERPTNNISWCMDTLIAWLQKNIPEQKDAIHLMDMDELVKLVLATADKYKESDDFLRNEYGP